MAPIKFEEHIKEQLEKREIQPSEGSWEKLNSRLDNSAAEKSPKWWIGIAAAVVVCLIISMFFIGQQHQTQNRIVEQPAKVEPVKKTEFQKPAEIASEENKEEIIPEVQKSEKPEQTIPQKKRETKSQNAVASTEIAKDFEVRNEEKPALAENALEKAETLPLLQKVNESEVQKQVNNKIEELIAKVNHREETGETVTDAEVNSLLAEAARELSRKKNFYSEGSVDADELLAQVESEMDQSFRQEVFELLKEGFIKAKTAVASRNY